LTNLKRIREASGLTQAALASASGVNIRMVQDYEQGHKDINKASAMTVYKLSEALGCSITDLMEGLE
jgi:transcriptional regulator with XRE-family HTH domain